MLVPGCKAFVHIPKDERSKLDDKTRQCVFVGYGQDEFGYRFYDPVQKKLIRSRDAVFVEDQTIKDIEKTDKVVPNSDDFIDLQPAPQNHVPVKDEDDLQGEQPDAFDIPAQHEEEEPPPPPPPEIPATEAQPPLRRSSRVPIPSRLYSPRQYAFVTERENLNAVKKQWKIRTKMNRLMPCKMRWNPCMRMTDLS